jgi:hypothetical protein
MQPDRKPTDWQVPPEQPSQAPYVVPTDTDEPVAEPVVTLTPDKASYTAAGTPAAAQPVPAAGNDEPVRWQAAEYIHHDKPVIWFVLFTIVVIALMAASIFLLDSITFTILIPVMAAALLVYNYRPPRTLDYTLSRQGLHINDVLYPFADFKGFGVIHDGKEYSVMLIPVKRFKLGVSVYFPEEAGEQIVDLLASRLPMRELHLDFFDKIIHKLRI